MQNVQFKIVFKPAKMKKNLESILEELVKSTMNKVLLKYPGTDYDGDIEIKRKHVD